jgi:hypothetical protein
MIHPLASCVAKLNRAELHAEAFDSKAGVTKSGMEQVIEFDTNQGPLPTWFRWQVSADWGAAPDISTGLGDAFHNLRCALDHLIWGLTLQGRGKVGRWTHFPIRSDKSGMSNDSVKRTLANLTADQASVIESLQPYHRRQPSKHPLVQLARLDDDDKHQALYVLELMPRNAAFNVVPIKDCDVLEVIPNLGVTLQSKAEIGRIRIRGKGRKPEIKMTADFVPEIRFPDGVLVLTRFQEMQMFVFEEVLPRLAPNLILDYPVARLPE